MKFSNEKHGQRIPHTLCDLYCGTTKENWDTLSYFQCINWDEKGSMPKNTC